MDSKNRPLPHSCIYSCKDCTKRYVGCHSTCEEYNNQKKEYVKQRDEIRKQKMLEYSIDEPQIKKAMKRKKKAQH